MDYVNTKMGLALSLRKQMSEQTFEEEYNGSVIKYMNHMFWGDKNIYDEQKKLFLKSIQEDLEN